ncbi:hypothetical protein QOZ80_1AG0017460 [Eleusine coracana subsp. coracana]|nr:hypothetical protein QOZ80_1AG0017460 [Eleusine coracana subsp. coracana]
MALGCARGLGAAAAEAQFVARLTASAAAGDLLSGAALHARYAKAHVPPTTYLANHLLLFYSRVALPALAHRLFDEMPRPNVFSHNALLAAHVFDPRRAKEVFSRVPDPDVVSYNTLLTAFASSGLATEAIQLLTTMRREDIPVDGFTVSSAVSAVTSPTTVAQLHAFAAVSGTETYASVKNSLMSGYGKGGLLEEAERVFAGMGDDARNHVSWNCMIAVYGQHGHGRKALELFQDMATKGLAADAFTLASMLSAFATAQDLDAGMELHGRLIKSNFTQNPHVASGLVDLTHGNVDLGAKAAKEILHLSPSNASAPVVLSNMYASAGKWEEAAKIGPQRFAD